jgi:hypothetical protein
MPPPNDATRANPPAADGRDAQRATARSWIPETKMPESFDLYRATGTAGDIGLPGAPILHFDLLVNSSTGMVSGQAQITRAAAPPNGVIRIDNVTGRVRRLVVGGQVTLVVALQGTSYRLGSPSAELTVQEQFTAQFMTNPQDGRGSFDYGNGSQVVNDVPVTIRGRPKD